MKVRRPSDIAQDMSKWQTLVAMRRRTRRDLRRLPSSKSWDADRYAKRRWIKTITTELNRRFPDAEKSEREDRRKSLKAIGEQKPMGKYRRPRYPRRKRW